MRFVLTLVALLFFSNMIFGQATVKKVDFSVKGIGLGATYLQVIAKLGKPAEHLTQHVPDGCLGEMFEYSLRYADGLDIFLIRDEQSKGPIVLGMNITSDRLTVDGLRVGMKIQLVRERFGEPQHISKYADEITYSYDTRSLDNESVELIFKNGILARMEQHVLIC